MASSATASTNGAPADPAATPAPAAGPAPAGDPPGLAPARYAADPYDYAEARALMAALDLAEPVAITLVRRGYRTVEQARAFLDGAERHDFRAFEGIEAAAARVIGAVEDGARITIHGDYDVDGICATAILVATLRSRGAACDWIIPDRAEGYGLSLEAIEALRERGTGLLITADCGIASPDEVAAAVAAGIETIVTDHHQPGEVLPDCAIVHPAVCGYPFEGLCGAAVAFKLAEAIAAEAPSSDAPAAAPERHLDLVALATVADLVPLVGENRTLARLGIAELRRARRPGLRGLLAVAGVEPERLDEGDIAFRLAPRLNAAGRLYRADAGVELMLTDDPARAQQIATELDAANRERREVEREVSRAAEAALRELSAEQREAPALVLAGSGWHPGVVGIAASRLVERHGRPAILLSIGADGRAKGSGRGIPGFDLLAALRECSAHLLRFGGHQAAAGLELDAEAIDAFRGDFIAAAARRLPKGPARRAERIDAVVGAEALDLRVAEQLEGLGPFGQGNPEVRLLVPWARVGEIRPMGEEGRHARFSLSSGYGSASGVAFNANGMLSAAKGAPSDLTVRLELNHWNGAVTPRAVLAGAEAGAPVEEAQPSAGACSCGRGGRDWWERFEAELEREPGPEALPDAAPPARTEIVHQRRSVVALISELLSSGARVLALTADARRRTALAREAAAPARFGGVQRVVCAGCAPGNLGAACAPHGPQLVLSEWAALGHEPSAASEIPHLVAVDPPPGAAFAGLARGGGPGHLHWVDAGGAEFASGCLTEQWQPRAALAQIYRGLVGGPLAGSELEALLTGVAAGGRPRHAKVAARCVRVLTELGLVQLSGDRGARELRVVSSERTELERSAAWRAYRAICEEGLRYLERPTAS